MLSEKEALELRYLAKRGPLWAGVLASKEKPPEITQWLADGLIEVVEGGYAITKKGRQECGADMPRCPTCNREF